MSKPKKDERSFSSSKNIEIPDNILTKLLTPSEVRMLKNRWQIVQSIKMGLSIRAVAEKVKVGTDTVVRMTRLMEKNNLREDVDKGKKMGRFKTNTPWIFGKND